MTSDAGFVAFNLLCYEKTTQAVAFEMIRQVDAPSKFYITS